MDIYKNEGSNKYEDLSDHLSSLVEHLKNYEKKISLETKEKIKEVLVKMRPLSKTLDGKILEIFDELEEKVFLFLDNPKELDRLIQICVDLKNQLWEL